MHKKSQHHEKLLIVGWAVAVLATLFVIRQRSQFPHEAFPVRGSTISNQARQQKPQPAMPMVNTEQQQ